LAGPSTGGERGDFLVLHTTVASISQPTEAVTGDTTRSPDPSAGESFGKLLRDGTHSLYSLFRPRLRQWPRSNFNTASLVHFSVTYLMGPGNSGMTRTAVEFDAQKWRKNLPALRATENLLNGCGAVMRCGCTARRYRS
jgi:hypothetical protein